MTFSMQPHTIIVDTVNEALPEGLWSLKVAGVEANSRNGKVIVAPGPVLTVYREPQKRVLFSPRRDCNPFFHAFESLWMLAGRNDVSYPSRFAPRMKEFSDDGISLNGAYGYRWRTRWFDQLPVIIEHLKKNPESRREVLTMWTAGDLIDDTSKDLPCNCSVFVDIREGTLNTTVCNRSNDMWWGAYGANAVHMSFLQEFLARAVGVEIGVYIQFSLNYHIYTELYEGREAVNNPVLFEYHDMYPATYPIMSTPYKSWLKEVEEFVVKGNARGYEDPFFTRVAAPMLNCWELYKEGNLEKAVDWTNYIVAKDWQLACREWLQRRLRSKNEQAEIHS